MEILEHIEEQVGATGLPLFAITVAAVPCPDTPIILTLHWHGFVRNKLANIDIANPVSYVSVPSSALQLNERWQDSWALENATLEAAWELGAWDVRRARRPGCMRPGADSREAWECLQAFGASPQGVHGQQSVVAEVPDADDLVEVAGRNGYLMWMFRPVRGGLWADVADDATLDEMGGRHPPCPLLPAKTESSNILYRLGIPSRTSIM